MAQPANDNCVNAETLNITATSQTINFDLTQASINYEEGCVGLAQDNDYADVWYQFTLAQSDGITITSYSGNRFALYDSCGGSQLACFAGTNNIENLSIGHTYYLRVYRRDIYVTNSDQDFSIQTIAASAPDCSTTQSLTVTTSSQNVNFDLSTETLNYEHGCDENDADSYKDIWYEISIPVNGSIEITSESINLFSLYDSCNGTQISCFAGGGLLPTYIDDLMQNTTYLLRVFRSELGSTNFQNFTIKAIEPVFPICSNPETLNISSTELAIDLDINNANYNYEYGCVTTADSYTDFWYEFTMPVDGNLLINVTAFNNAIIYDSCGGSMLYCFNENKLIDDLVQGQTYTIRVFRAQSTSATFGQQWTIRTYERILNDDCANAEMLPILTSENTQVQFYLAGATLNTEETCVGSTDYVADAWWQFTMPVTGNLFIDTPDATGIAIYDTCNGTEMFCNASESSLDSFKLIDNLIEGNTYLIRNFSSETRILESDFQALNIRVYERAANDECVNAETIPTITDTPQEIIFDTRGSLINFEESCVGLPEEDFVDVWFEFTMPNSTYLNFDSYYLNFFSIYDACNGNEVACFAGVEQVSGLTPNQTYILRVFQRQSEMFHPYYFFDIWTSNTLGTEDIDTVKTTIDMISFNTLRIRQISESAHVDIYNLLGQHIKRFNLKPSNQQDITLNNIANGVYIAKLTMESLEKSKKIVVKN